jgi:hypothetical protein
VREAVWRSLVAFSVRRRVITIFSAPGDAEDLEMEAIPPWTVPKEVVKQTNYASIIVATSTMIM